MSTPHERKRTNLAWFLRPALALALGLGILAGVLPLARDAGAAGPTPEQKARCDAFPGGNQLFCTSAYASLATPLKFPEDVQGSLSIASANKMAIYKPAGNGPFPAVVLLHTCGPIDGHHAHYWIAAALERGYVAFLVDSWEQRGLSSGGVCAFRPDFPANSVRTRDAYDALGHLGKFGFVDKSRVAVMGFSQGGRVAYHLASKTVAGMFAPDGRRFAAAVAVYGECFFRPRQLSNIRPDIDTPVLSLLGDKDEDGDPKECVPRLQAAKDGGAPVEWHVFAGAGHAWDHYKFNQSRDIAYAGSPRGMVYYAYNAKITEETRERAFAFLARHLKPR